MKSHLMLVLKIVISVGILYLLFRGMDFKAFLRVISAVRPVSVIVAFFIILFVQCISALRWKIILSKDMDAKYSKLLSMYLIGMFFNNFLPTLVGGDLIKTYYLYKESGKGSVALASIFLDRYSGFSALILITSFALLIGHGLLDGTGFIGFFFLLIGAFLCASLVLWVNFLHSWAMNIMSRIHLYGINHKIDAFYRVLMSYKAHLPKLLKAFAISLVVQGGVMFAYYLLGRGIGMTVPLGIYFLFVPLATVASMVPISLAGLGVREGVFIYLFTKIGASSEEALSLSLLFFFVQLMVSSLGGIEYVRIGGKKMMRDAEDVTMES